MAAVEGLLIAGERVPAAEGRTFDSVNPANGEVFRTVAEAGPEDADRAVRAAAAAFEDWAARTPIQRAKVLYRFADLIESLYADPPGPGIGCPPTGAVTEPISVAEVVTNRERAG